MQRDIITVTSMTLFKLNLFFSHKSSKKQEKEARTNFVLLYPSRNMVE